MNKKGIRNEAIQSLLTIVGGKGEVKGQVSPGSRGARCPEVVQLVGGSRMEREAGVCVCLRGKKKRTMNTLMNRISCCSRCGWLAGPSPSGPPLGSAHCRHRLPEARSWGASSLLEQTHTVDDHLLKATVKYSHEYAYSYAGRLCVQWN